MTSSFWKGRRVFLTGHTGFKGAWAATWLVAMGARVTGFAHAPETDPNLWSLLGLAEVDDVEADLNDRAALDVALHRADPEVVLHLAAQALVRRSYRDPVETFATNVLGTVNLLDAARACKNLRAIVVATSDKAYENVEQIWGYRESDPMGGRDPYSASKGACEIATSAMAKSFFAPCANGGHPARVATVRAGNVIGGGDWSEDRLVPDIVRGCLGPQGSLTLRAPGSIRPWQHVLEPIRGYLMVAERLAAGDDAAASGWNFGPEPADERAVIEVAQAMVKTLGKGRILIEESAANPHEARLLRLDCARARAELGWVPALHFDESVAMTAGWYADWAAGRPAVEICREQIAAYEGKISR
ncbi:MAG: CDP-glucose 4,6-dehydratase [Paracoccaceae bacterium]